MTAQVLHALKSTSARVLVLVVSMGYGVVKPRLGAAYKQIVVGGVIYFILASIYGVYHNKDQTMVSFCCCLAYTRGATNSVSLVSSVNPKRR